MVQVAARVVEAARGAERWLAGRETPFVENAWYVAGFSTEFSRVLKARTILGRPLVLYRSGDGKPVAMDDRCPHRSFPLSKSRLDGDTIICGYHGLTYDRSGRCVAIPGEAREPRGIGVRSYPLREQGPLVWIWLGAEEPASELPLGGWTADAAWPSSNTYFRLKANYLSLHENLLDLTHLSFLHADTFGTPDYALAPYEVELDDEAGHFAVLRTVTPTRLPPIWGRPTRLEGKDAARIARSEFLGPSTHMVNVRFWACETAEDQRPDLQVRTGHMATPETANTTHYFIHHARNFAVDDEAVTRFMHDQLLAAFQEDVDGLEALEAMIAATPPGDYYEVAIAADRAGLAMRRWIRRQAEREAI